jgi:hypothetical protein
MGEKVSLINTETPHLPKVGADTNRMEKRNDCLLVRTPTRGKISEIRYLR